MISTWKILAACSWPTIVFASVVIIRQMRRGSQNIRLPVTEKLLRAPGESLRQKIEVLDEQLFHRFLIMFIACSAAALSILEFFAIISLIPFILLNILAVGWVMKLLIKRSNYSLGLSGERAVGEELNKLMRQGCYVFHDMPKPDKSNIDHVVIASSGVYVIETKTRRKKKAPPGKQDHEIIFDRERLHFPHWTDSYGIEQTRGNARWLSDYLSKSLAEPVRVTPILTLPGWFVNTRANSDLKVLNPKQITGFVMSQPSGALTQKQLGQIAFRLEEKCRNVEF